MPLGRWRDRPAPRARERLVPVAVSEAVHLVLDRRAVARTDAADFACEKGDGRVLADNGIVRGWSRDRAEQLRRDSALLIGDIVRRRRPKAAAQAGHQSSARRGEGACGLEAGQRQLQRGAAGRARWRRARRPGARAAVHPKWSLPPRQVPVARITALAGSARPSASVRPVTRRPSSRSALASPSITAKPC